MHVKKAIKTNIFLPAIIVLSFLSVIQWKHACQRLSTADIIIYRDEHVNQNFGFAEVPVEPQKHEHATKTYPRYDDSLLVEWEPPPQGNTTLFTTKSQDLRHSECLNTTYPQKLPMTTVVIVFKNESISMINTTIWSIYTHSPRSLVKEFILVDYNSSPKKLDEYIQEIPVKIRAFKLQNTSNVAEAKQFAVQFVTTPTITFVDATYKCLDGWLEPLLAKILENRQIAVTPVIDNNVGSYGVFDINLRLQRAAIPERERNRSNSDKSSNIRSPVFPGEIFVVDKEFFDDIGGYDYKITNHAEEMIELSLKVWMCGGGIEIVPCARVVHIETTKTTSPFVDGIDLSMQKSTSRIVDMWFDEYQKVYYGFHPGDIAKRGNVSEQLEKRHRLQCKSFNWYLENVYPESMYARKYNYIGSIESMSKKDSCFNSHISNEARVSNCQPIANNKQALMFTDKGEILTNQNCLTVARLGKPLKYMPCSSLYMNSAEPDQKFMHEWKDNSLRHNEQSCMTLRSDDAIILKPCDGSLIQKWKIHNFVPPDSLFF